ncbi:MAG: gliding motility-associated C-terminal domain-containing protein [Flavobacteriales bacterium]|nr:gliding motility-associated C-terminal domain-containing protein [Flavobacteriales bacterium]
MYGTLPLCASSPAAVLFAELGGTPDAGGSWTDPNGNAHSGTFDPATDPGGVYTYTIIGQVPCPSASATVTVSVEPLPDAGLDAVVDVCTGDPSFDLFPELGGSPDAGGLWMDPNGNVFVGPFDPAVSTPGDYTYTVTGMVCGPDVSTVTVNVLQGPNAGLDNTLLLCSSASPFLPLDSLAGTPDSGGSWTDPNGSPFAGNIDPATGLPGDYTYTVPGNGICAADQAVLTVSLSQAVDAGLNGSLTLCETGAPQSLFAQLGGTPDVGGSWTDPNGDLFNDPLDPAITIAGSYVYTVTGPAPCPSATATVIVDIIPAPDAGGDSSLIVCDLDAAFGLSDALGGTPDAGGSWSAPGGQVFTGSFDPGGDVPGAYTYTVNGQAPCGADQAVVTIAVSASVYAGDDGSIVLCANDAEFMLFDSLAGGPAPGGGWTDPNGDAFSGQLDPANSASGNYTYTVNATAPCPADVALLLVDVIPVPTAAFQVDLSDGCSPVSAVFIPDYNGPGSFTWDFGDGTWFVGPQPDTVLYAAPGSYDVTLMVDAGNGCGADTATLIGAVEVFLQPTASFLTNPDAVNTTDPTVVFINTSQGAGSFLWDFSGLGTSTNANPVHVFPAELDGQYEVCLEAIASPTCLDTACTMITVEPGVTVHVPNAFTPDGDGINDAFVPVVIGVASDGYRFDIFDRWGQPLFSTERPDEAWDGTFGGGEQVPIGVYVWKLVARDPYSGLRVERTGHVTVVR